MLVQIAINHLKTVCDSLDYTNDNLEPLITTAMTSLGSKMY